ncbi:MAG: peptidoglycan-associated lipoprotein Pal [Pseudomonadota bacterium]
MSMKYLTLIGAALVLAACSSEPEPDAGPATGATGGGGGVAGGPAPNTIEYFNQVVGDRVFFDTDRFNIDDEAARTLTAQAQWMAANPGTTATIEGHADERGTRQYNLALGARRANAVRLFLIRQGVAADRLRSVTFGKERPIALGSDPASWAQNRRGMTVVAGAPSS